MTRSSGPRVDKKSGRINTDSADKQFERLHRDYYVMFNDSFRLTVDDGVSSGQSSDIEISSLVESINISYNIDSPPASCDLTMRVKKSSHVDRKLRDIVDNFREMDEVRVFFKNRFPYKSSDGAEPEFGYSQVFWGIVVGKKKTVEENYIQLNMSCQDMLWWWSRMRFNSNPALIDRSNSEYNQLGGVYKFIYGYMSPFAIINFISRSLPEDFASQIAGTAQRAGSDADNLKRSAPYNRWVLRFTQISKNLQIVGVRSIASDGDNPDYKRYMATKVGTDKMKVPNAQEPGNNFDIGTGEHILKSTLTLDQEFLENIRPYADIIKPSTFESVFKTRLEIAQEVAKIIGFEFFQDTNGKVLFKPPYYNMHVSAYENPVYVLDPLDIESADFGVDVGEILTELSVSGKIQEEHSSSDALSNATFALYRDTHLASMYGIQDEHITLEWVLTKEQALMFAIGELDRLNAKAYKSNVTIVGRPELRLGRPVYIVGEDCFYYIRGISHAYTNGSFTTSLDLDTRRGRFINPETKEYMENMTAVIKQIDNNKGGNTIRPITGAIMSGGTVSYESGGGSQDHMTRNDEEVRKPVADNFGYDLVGAFAYGKKLMVGADGEITKRSNYSPERRKAEKLANVGTTPYDVIERQSDHPDLKDNFDSGFQDLLSGGFGGSSGGSSGRSGSGGGSFLGSLLGDLANGVGNKIKEVVQKVDLAGVGDFLKAKVKSEVDKKLSEKTDIKLSKK